MSTAPRILILRLSSMGDVIICTAALDAIRARHPGARITWVVAREFAQLLEGDPRIHTLIAFDRKSGLGAWRRLMAQLLPEADQIYDLHGSLRTRCARLMLLSRRTGGRPSWHSISKQRLRRWGYFCFKALWPRALRPRPLLQRVVDSTSGGATVAKRAVPDLRHLLKHPVRGSSGEWMAQFGAQSEQGRLLAVMPGAAWAGKRWPAHRFIKAMASVPDATWVILGKSGEKACEDLQRVCEGASIPTAPAFRYLDLVEQAQLLSKTRCLLGNDTGMAHLAEALGVPVVTVFGPTRADLGFGPWQAASRSLETGLWCSPCSKDGSACFRLRKARHECLRHIDEAAVSRAIREAVDPEPAQKVHAGTPIAARVSRRSTAALYRLVMRCLGLPIRGLLRLTGAYVRAGGWDWNQAPLIGRANASALAAQPARLVWFHAASAGELEMLWEVARSIKRLGFRIGLSVFSPSGFRGVERFAAEFAPVYAGPSPWEGEWLKFFSEKLGEFPAAWITSKYEAWPELWGTAAEQDVPIFVINGDDRPSVRWAARITRLVFGACPRIQFSTTDHDSRLRIELSELKPLLAEATQCLGDPRWDRVALRQSLGSSRASQLVSAALALQLPKPWWVIGSAWPEDLDFLLVDPVLPNGGTLWVVPHDLGGRSLRRLGQQLERACGSKPLRTSTLGGKSAAQHPGSSAVASPAILVDELGVLVELYRHAELAWVGGGFKTGLHSVIEPALAGIPVACGPMGAERFPEVAALAATGQLCVVRSRAELFSWWERSLGLFERGRPILEWRQAYQLGSAERCGQWILQGIKRI